jgi:glycosyltransferase involved in cell wall biosynthesis
LLDGYVDERHLDELLAGSRLVLLPYLDATQSGVGLRAVASGIPCIVTDEGALPDLVPGELGSFVIPSGDPEALAAAIVAHVDHDAALRAAFHAHAARHLDWPVVGRVLLDELRRLRLLSGGRAGGKEHARA